MGFQLAMGVPPLARWMVCFMSISWKIPWKIPIQRWMRTGGSPILGSPPKKQLWIMAHLQMLYLFIVGDFQLQPMRIKHCRKGWRFMISTPFIALCTWGVWSKPVKWRDSGIQATNRWICGVFIDGQVITNRIVSWGFMGLHQQVEMFNGLAEIGYSMDTFDGYNSRE